MKKLLKIIGLFSFTFILMITGCNNVDKKEITGISFKDATFVYDGSPKNIFIEGDLPEGVSVSYEGNGKIEVGVYTIVASFTVPKNYVALEDMTATLTITEAPKILVTGVVNDGVYYGTVKPTFNLGTATLKKDDEVATPFISGTEVSELGNYVLSIVDGSNTVTLNFSIQEQYVVYDNQITDMFENLTPHKSYIKDSNLDVSLSDGNLIMLNKTGGDPWGILKREFKSVNATEYPYLEISVEKVYSGAATRLEVALMDGEWSTDATLLSIQYSGLYHINVLDYVKSKGMSETNANIYIKLAVVGQSAGYAGVEINYFKSIKELPLKTKATQYIDESIETLALWRNNTASIEIVDNEAVGFVTNVVDPYGNFIKRVELNTVDYQELVVNIKEIKGNASWSLKYQIDNGPEVALIQSSTSGLFTVNLEKFSDLKDQENITVMLLFYVIGNGDNDFVVINGIRTQYLEPTTDTSIIDDMQTDTWNSSLGTKVYEAGSTSITKDFGTSMAKLSKTLTLNTIKNRYVAFYLNTTFVIDPGFSIQVIDQSKPGWPLYKYQGIDFVESFIDNGDGTYTYVYVLDLNMQPVFMNEESTDLFFEIVIEFGDNAKTAKLTGVKYYTPIDKTIIDDMKTDSWTVSQGTKVYEDGKLTITKESSDSMAKFSKIFTLDTVNNRYVALYLKTTFVIDPGFSVLVIDQSKPGWPMYKFQGTDYVESFIDNGDGTYSYVYVLDLNMQPVFMNEESTDLFFEIVIEFGDNAKTASLTGVKYYTPVDKTIIDDMKTDSWTVAIGTKVYEEGTLIVTKESDDSMAKFSKTFTLDTVNNQYVAFYLNTTFVIDPGFSIIVIDQSKPGWPMYKYQGADYVESFIDNGDGTYSYVYLLDLNMQPVFMDQQSTNLFFEVVVEFGDNVKTAKLTGVRYFSPVE